MCVQNCPATIIGTNPPQEKYKHLACDKRYRYAMKTCNQDMQYAYAMQICPVSAMQVGVLIASWGYLGADLGVRARFRGAQVESELTDGRIQRP